MSFFAEPLVKINISLVTIFPLQQKNLSAYEIFNNNNKSALHIVVTHISLDNTHIHTYICQKMYYTHISEECEEEAG